MGGTRAVPVDIRIISATNRRLEEMFTGGSFRSDQWFRLNVFPIYIRRVLKMTGGKIHGPEGAAEILKINPNTLRTRMKKLKIPFGRHPVEEH